MVRTTFGIEDPSSARQVIENWEDVKQAAIAQAGTWIKVERLVNTGTAHAIKTNRHGSFVSGSWDATMRNCNKIQRNRGIVYLRYLGE